MRSQLHCYITTTYFLQWYGGDFLCRSVKWGSVFAFCLTSNMIVCIALDRAILSHRLTVHVSQLHSNSRTRLVNVNTHSRTL
jgi:hypothetical protein